MNFLKFHPFNFACWHLALLAVFMVNSTCLAQDLTSQETRSLKQIQNNISLAGEQFKAKKFKASKRFIERAIKEFEKLADGTPSEKLIEALTPEFERLTKAHELLSDNGQELVPLKPFNGSVGVGGPVSFTKSVAPILVAKCGNCHVNQSRGNFSFASFDALDKSTAISYGSPDTSRLIEVIESGEMPKGGLKVDAKELRLLRTWIEQGAKYDGQNPRQNLTMFVSAPRPANRRNLEAKSPTGKETVSFGLDVAPVLLENCAQCHITRNPRGNFSMADFRSFLRGGDGGNSIVPGKSGESQLVMRLRGDGVEIMPPSGKLNDDVIARIAKWIDEGATFDGGDTRLPMQTVANKVKAASQTHQELTEARQALAARTWKLVMDGVEGTEIPSENFVVTGSTTESRLADISLLCESLVPKISKELKASTQQPLVKGNVSVFVFDKRYDFSEFGKMVENRDFPKTIRGHWGFTTIDAYATVLMTRNQNPPDIQSSLAQQIAAIHVASLGSDIPRWFADGLGLYTARKIYSRTDEMKELDGNAEIALAEMIKPDDFIQNKMPADKAALVSYLFIKSLRGSAGNYTKLMRALGKDTGFDAAFQSSYGKTPTEMILGVQKSVQRRQNRR